jgi:hypothetical protein
MKDDTNRDPAVQPNGASCGGRTSASSLPGNTLCTSRGDPWHPRGMHLSLVTDPTPEWIIGEDVAAGDAWLVHARAPRFTAKVRQSEVICPQDAAVHLDCGFALVDLRWTGTTRIPSNSEDVIKNADRVIHAWAQRQLSRVCRLR